VGGGAITRELHPGFHCPALTHDVLLWSGIAREMALERYGLQRLTPVTELFAPDADGTAITLRADAPAYGEFRRALGQGADVVGELLASRGVGTMIAMFAVGRIGDRVPPLSLMVPGIALTGASFYWMTLFSLDTTPAMVVGSGLMQGLGIGLVFVPLTTMTFSTLPPGLRNEGTALFTLMRNVGSSVGVSFVTSELARYTQANHAALAQYASPFNEATRLPGYPAEWALQAPSSIAALEHEISRQAQLLAYVQDFRLMLWLCILSMPLLFMFSSRRTAAAPPTLVD